MERRRFLVTGGAGYVGSHVVLALADRGDDVTVLDDLSLGHAHSVPDGVHLVEGNLSDAAFWTACSRDGRARVPGTGCCISPRFPWSATAWRARCIT